MNILSNILRGFFSGGGDYVAPAEYEHQKNWHLNSFSHKICTQNGVENSTHVFEKSNQIEKCTSEVHSLGSREMRRNSQCLKWTPNKRHN